MRKISSKDVYSQNISHINIGSGHEVTIKELAILICEVVGFNGGLKFDITKPDGTPRKLLNTSLMDNFGWKSDTSLKKRY